MTEGDVTVKVEVVEGYVDVWAVVFADVHLIQDSEDLFYSPDRAGEDVLTIRGSKSGTASHWLIPLAIRVESASEILTPRWLTSRNLSYYYVKWYKDDGTLSYIETIHYDDSGVLNFTGVAEATDGIPCLIFVDELNTVHVTASTVPAPGTCRFLLNDFSVYLRGRMEETDPEHLEPRDFSCHLYAAFPGGKVARYSFTWHVPGKSEAFQYYLSQRGDITLPSR